MNIETVNELIQSLESAGELSIKERKYLDIMRWAVGVAGERDAALNAERVWEKTMMEACGEDGPASVASEIRALQVLRDTRIQALNSQVEQLAAENVGLRETVEAVRGVADNSSGIAGWHLNGDIATWGEILPEIDDLETPATDRIVAGIKADGVEEFAESQKEYVRQHRNEMDQMLRAAYAGSAVDAERFAKQLREGADK